MAINACTLAIQEKLQMISKQPKYTRVTGVLDAITADTNATNMQARMVQPNGLAKDKSYELIYVTPECTAPVDCSTIACTDVAAATTTETRSVFSGMSCKSIPWKVLTQDQFDSLCQNTPDAFFVDKIIQYKDLILKAVNDEWRTTVCANVGCIKTGTTTRAVGLVNVSTKTAANMAITDVQLDFVDAGFPMSPIIIGGRELMYYNASVNLGGVNTAGNNVAQFPVLESYYDNVLSATCTPATVGNSTAVAIMPGMFQYINWSDNAGVLNTGSFDFSNIKVTSANDNNGINAIIVDPATGFVFDLDIVKMPKCKTYEYRLSLQYKLHKMPVVGCQDSCFTGVIKYDICPIPTVVC